VIVFRDVSSARALAEQIAHLAEHDFLTGLPNRMLLNDRIGQAIALAPRHGKKVALLYIDLDGFKQINDSLGHPSGDKLLQSVATRLQGCVRGTDTVSRQGGDEFVVLLSEVQRSEDVATLARQIVESVAESHSIDGQNLFVNGSIGVSIYPDDGLTAESLLKNADTAMYRAKTDGRKRYRFFTPSMNDPDVEPLPIRPGVPSLVRRAK
jgi:diguanylate cyclase (GGDEF)-like protein